MRKDIFDILAYCSKKEIHALMSTNGWFVDIEVARELKSTGIPHVRVSLDGATAEVHDSIRRVPGSFVRAVKALENLRRAQIPIVGVSPTVLPDNFHQIGAIIDLSIEKGVDEIQVVQLCRVGRGEKVSELTTDQLNYAKQEVQKRISKYKNQNINATEGIVKKKCNVCVQNKTAVPGFIGCVGGRTCAAIDFKGLVSPCILYRRKAGNLREKSFREIWYHSSLFLKMREIRGACLNCDFSDICVRECLLERKLTEKERIEVVKSLRMFPDQEVGCYQMGLTDCFIQI